MDLFESLSLITTITLGENFITVFVLGFIQTIDHII